MVDANQNVDDDVHAWLGDHTLVHVGLAWRLLPMLVLSRRVEQEIVFPHLDITVSILQVRGRIVKVGVVAPDNVKILRSEAAQQTDPSSAVPLTDAEQAEQDQAIHRRRNQLNLLQLRLDAIQLRIDRGEVVDADSMLHTFFKETAAFASEVTQAELPPLAHRSGRPIRLLVVEDCDNERGLMAYLLASQGFVVQVARDGNEAIAQLLGHGGMPDFVMMDMHMPLADGAETLLRIRADHRLADLRVFAVTGDPRPTRTTSDDHGWDAWFSKPLDVKLLVTHIHEQVSLHREPALQSI